MASAKKATTRRTRGKPKGNIDETVVKRHNLEPVLMDIDAITEYPGNPNVGGNEAELDDSLLTNGQYQPIKVQQSTSYCLAGNHTWKRLKELGATVIYAIVLDVDDTEAKRIVLADNNIGKMANIDRILEANLVASLPDAHGTGFSAVDLELMERMSKAAIEDYVADGGEESVMERAQRSVLGGIDAPDADVDDDWSAEESAANDELDKVEADLGGMYDLKEDQQWESKHPMGYPPLRPDMLVEELPQPLDSWAGSATRDDPRMDDPKNPVWWLYNYGVDSTSGMKDLTKIIMSFYTEDEYFENAYFQPATFVGRMMNSGIKYSLTPNYSMWLDQPFVVSLYNLFRSRWVGRYMQECGIRVIPDLQWGFGHPDAYKIIDQHTSYGIPTPLPIGAIQLQTGSERWDDPKYAADVIEQVRYAVKKMDVQQLLVYSGRPGKEQIADKDLGTNVLWLPNRTMKLSAHKKAQQAAKAKSGTV